MNSPKIWLEMAIVGFVFLVAAAFFALACFHTEDLGFLEKLSNLLPYISVVVVLLSYVVGLSLHIISQAVLSSENEKAITRADAMFDAKIPERAIRLVETSYSTFALYRLLSVGTYLLGMALLAWSHYTKFMGYVVGFASFFLGLSAIFLCTYVVMRKPQSQLKQQFTDAFKKRDVEEPPQAASPNKPQHGARSLNRRG